MNLVYIENNVLITDSLLLAHEFDKDHKNVLADIEHQITKLNEAGESQWGVLNFQHTTYQHQQNKQWYPKINLTEDAFAIVAMSYVTAEAMKAKVKFLNQFRQMKNELNSYVNPTHPIEDGIIHALQGIKQIKEENAQLKLHQAQQTTAMTELKLVVDNEIWLTENQKADIKDRVMNRTGVLKQLGYQSSFQGVYSALNTHFNVPKYDKIPRKDYERALDFIRGWYPKKIAR